MNIDQLLAHLKKLTSTLSTAQLVGLVAVFLAVVGVVVGSAYWISEPQFTLLVADMDAETAQSVITRIREGLTRNLLIAIAIASLLIAVGAAVWISMTVSPGGGRRSTVRTAVLPLRRRTPSS